MITSRCLRALYTEGVDTHEDNLLIDTRSG